MLVAASHDHVITWHWAHRETAHAEQILNNITEPLCVLLDGGQGTFTAIKAYWPNALIQRFLVHTQRVVHRCTISRPRTDEGKAIYKLALTLTRITTLDQAREWTLRLHEFGPVYRSFLDKKTPLPPESRTLNKQWEWTHPRVRKAYNSLFHLS